MKKITYIGIDICSLRLDINCLGKYQAIPFNEKSVLDYINQINEKYEHPQLIFEATGTLSRKLIAWVNGKISYTCLNPCRVRHFAIGCNILAKNDKCDAKLLAYYGVNQQPEANVVLTNAQLKAKELQSCLCFITRQKAKAKCRLKAAECKFEIDILNETIEVHEKHETQIEAEIEELIKEDPLMNKICKQLQTVKGIAKKSAMRIIICLPELGTISRKKITSLVGLCRYAWESGTKSGSRALRTGRKLVRAALYMCAMVASRCNDEIHEFYQRLILKGKPKKLAIVACARKLLLHINSLAEKIIKEEASC